MSDYIPFEIQVEIIKRFPEKSLAQFRSVSKRWKSLIDSSNFISGYMSSRHTQPHRLLVWYEEDRGSASNTAAEKYLSFLDDETFALQQVVPGLPVLAKLFRKTWVVGSSHGLLCLCDYNPYCSVGNSAPTMAVVWNPMMKKSIGVAVPSELCLGFENVLGFGVCPITYDPMILMFTCGMRVIPFVVELFTLSAGVWRVLSTSTLPEKSIRVTWNQVVLDRFIHWFAFDPTLDFKGEMILSFDMTTQEFSTVDIPFSSENQYCNGVSISKVYGSLAVLEYIEDIEQSCNVYTLMDHRDPKSLTLLFIIDTPYPIILFSKSGKSVMEAYDYSKPAELVVYEPVARSTNGMKIYGKFGSFFVETYMESLLLIDQVDCCVYQTLSN